MQRGITLLVLLFMITFTKGQRRITFDKAVLSQKVQQLSGSKDSAVVRRYLIRTTDLSRMNQLLSSNGLLSAVKQTFIPGKVIMLELPFTRINELFGKTDLIEFIDARPAPVEETHINGFDRTANGLNLMRVKYPRYNGEGLVVSIKERRFDTSDIDLKNRIIFSGLEAETMTTHASQMATMIAGGGNSSDFSLGAAWGAGVSSSSFETLLPDAIESYVNSKISVQNHSYGTAVENYYGADAAAYDASVRELPYLLHVFSAGNSGDMTPGTGTYTGIAGVANITGSFKMAKNILTIGATDSLSKLESRSSRGPAYDGRIKPELVAYGHDGSSGAAAIVSGIALTLQQAYKEKEGKLPDASLVKAVIMNTADDVGKPGPDFESGYGAANGLHALQAVDSGWYASGRTTAGEDKNHLIRIPAGVAKLKVMLTWSDPEAEANAVKALVNNLDVEVSNSSSMVFKPWILHT
ncbi:MAG TPA: S8 family serine peptidase, partial [Flavitalea sp.]|nr:S8 family serine peptidase [Flavitalea sp.]